jgi:hypothetical protein
VSWVNAKQIREGGVHLRDVHDADHINGENMTTDGTLASLQPGWATEVVQTHPFGIRLNSIIPQSLRGPSPTASHTPTTTAPPTSTAAPASPTPTAEVEATPTPSEAPTGDATPTATPFAFCAGDCNGDGEVTIDELILGVGIALNETPLARCPRLDADGEGTITIEELVSAVLNALNVCAG